MAKTINPFDLHDAPPFAGFPEDALKFFRQLKKNNTREWFAENKERFESSVKEPMESLLSTLAEGVRSIDPAIVIDPKKSLYRIYRDTRFSKDKTPYKLWIAASFTHAGKNKTNDPGFYFHVSADEVGIGGGLYMPMPDQLRRLRAVLDTRARELRAILAEKTFRARFGELQGETLSRVPQGYDKEHPDADLLKMKQFFCWASLDAKSACSPDLPDLLLKHIAAMHPLVRWLLAHA